ncbi:UDP-N-acetylglucosamine transferase subunit ALG14 homolog [Nilaparvata lugens]|uniref:UDP-N-acetylglucosamine transferase subunit ALG14 homolog n=1 Tax=Nilaparvata lugens TaxID=108931 RepID=UPI00193E1D4B|nr:UDP-N-acetylglucosamine transferase subunit ALG14 homolog [Nilaparvata lugens]
MWLLAFLFILLNAIYFFACRFSYLMYQIMYKTRPKEKKRDKSVDKVKTLIVIGSGGHTTEMMLLVEKLDFRNYSPRTYVIADTDTMSEGKVLRCEGENEGENEVKEGKNEAKNEVKECENEVNEVNKDYKILKIPRSREVHQSFLTSVITTLESIFYTLPIMLRVNPDLILCNGPGTCIPVCVIAFLMRLFFVSNNRIIFVESVCRVQTLSLTGKILLFIADEVLVQWPDLTAEYPRAKFIGRL